MKVVFRSPQREGARWQPRVILRVREVLRHLRTVVARVRVHLEDVNGPLPGVDKRCRVEVELAGGGVARIAATARTWQQSVDAVAARLKQRVVMQLHHSQTR